MIKIIHEQAMIPFQTEVANCERRGWKPLYETFQSQTLMPADGGEYTFFSMLMEKK